MNDLTPIIIDLGSMGPQPNLNKNDWNDIDAFKDIIISMFDEDSPHPFGDWYTAAVNKWDNVILKNIRGICELLQCFSEESLTEVSQGSFQACLRTEKINKIIMSSLVI